MRRLGALLLIFALDTAYYSAPILTPLSFISTNASHVSLFYGSSPWHYYFTQALPLLCGTALPFVLHGFAKRYDEKISIVAGLVAWTTMVYSFAGHKEWRFLHPMLPLLLLFASKSLVDAYYHRHLSSAKQDTLPILKSHFFVLLLVLPLLLYTTLFHSCAQISVLHYLRNIPETELQSVGFLMPCHSTPGQSHLHRPLGEGLVWSIGCEPPLGLQYVPFGLTSVALYLTSIMVAGMNW